jgi:hypothetical protein
LYETWKQSGLYPYYEDHGYDDTNTDLFRVKNLKVTELVSCTQQDKHQYAWGIPYWRSETRCFHWSRVAEPLYMAAYFSLTGIDGVTEFCWDMSCREPWNDSLEMIPNGDPFHLRKDIPWQMAFRAAGRLYKSGELSPLLARDPRLGTLQQNSDITTPQVMRDHRQGILTVETKHFAAVGSDHPVKKSFSLCEMDITSGQCNVVVMEELSEKEYEVTAVGMSGKSFGEGMQDWKPMTYVSGSIDFRRRKIKSVTYLNDLGKEIKREMGKGSIFSFADNVRLYRIEMEP